MIIATKSHYVWVLKVNYGFEKRYVQLDNRYIYIYNACEGCLRASPARSPSPIDFRIFLRRVKACWNLGFEGFSCHPRGKNWNKMLPAVRNTENETISDFENQDLAVPGPGDRSGMLFVLIRDGSERFRTPLNTNSWWSAYLAPGTLSGISNSTNLKTRSTARHWIGTDICGPTSAPTMLPRAGSSIFPKADNISRMSSQRSVFFEGFLDATDPSIQSINLI